MLPVLLVDLGFLLAGAGFLTLLRPIRRLGVPNRARALLLLLLGAGVVALGALLPAPDRRAAETRSRLDAVIPLWQFAEQHEIRIHAAPEAVERAIRDVTAREIRLFRLLTWMRNPRLPWRREPVSILAPPADEPILATALRSGFQPLAEEPGRELVFGTLVVVPEEIRALSGAERERLRAGLTAARFAALDDPGYAKAVMNFRWSGEGGGWTRLTTETRVVGTDAAARRQFGVYWRIIYPGSSLIRRTWLAAIRARAERAGAAAPR